MQSRGEIISCSYCGKTLLPMLTAIETSSGSYCNARCMAKSKLKREIEDIENERAVSISRTRANII